MPSLPSWFSYPQLPKLSHARPLDGQSKARTKTPPRLETTLLVVAFVPLQVDSECKSVLKPSSKEFFGCVTSRRKSMKVIHNPVWMGLPPKLPNKPSHSSNQTNQPREYFAGPCRMVVVWWDAARDRCHLAFKRLHVCFNF